MSNYFTAGSGGTPSPYSIPTPYFNGRGSTGATTGAGAATPGTPYSTPIPGVSDYLGQQLIAKQAYEAALARINASRSSTLRMAGYIPNSGGKLQVDPNNPYGGLQSMLRGQAQEDTASENSMVDRGLQYGGLANHARSDLQYNHGKQSMEFGNALTQAIASLAGQQQDAGFSYQNSIWQSQHDALLQALAQQNFNPALTPPTDPNNPNAPTTKTGLGYGTNQPWTAGW